MLEIMYTLVNTLVQQGQRRAEEGNGVKLDSLAMPIFTGRVGEDLYRFIDQISHFLCNYVRPVEWIARLKNAVQKDTITRDDPEHQLYLDFYEEMGTPAAFYWYTLRAAPPDDIHWMTEAEIDDVIVHNPQAVLTFEEPEAAQVGPNPTAGSSLARM